MENYDGETLAVTRGMCGELRANRRRRNQRPAFGDSRASQVPRCAPPSRGKSTCGKCLRTRNSTPLAMNNLLNDQILPRSTSARAG